MGIGKNLLHYNQHSEYDNWITAHFLTSSTTEITYLTVIVSEICVDK